MTENPLDRAPVMESPPEILRRCAMCKVEKARSEFYGNPKSGQFRSYCRPCYRKWNNAKYGERRAYLLAYHKKNRAADLEKYKARRKESYKRNKEAELAGNRERYRNNREKICARAREWRAKNPDKQFARVLGSRFNITVDQYRQMLTAQDGLCALCRKPEDAIFEKDGTPQRLSVDHDHACCSGHRSCGKCIRGLLCSSCNSALGLMKDDEARMMLAVEYIRKWKA